MWIVALVRKVLNEIDHQKLISEFVILPKGVHAEVAVKEAMLMEGID